MTEIIKGHKMADDPTDLNLAIALFSEVVAAEQMIKARLSRKLPKGMEMSHFSLLNHLSSSGERSPVQLARAFNLTKGAMTNTLQKLEISGYIHVRPDWEDARKKLVSISNAGEAAREQAARAVRPVFENVVRNISGTDIKQTLPVLRELRHILDKP